MSSRAYPVIATAQKIVQKVAHAGLLAGLPGQPSLKIDYAPIACRNDTT